MRYLYVVHVPIVGTPTPTSYDPLSQRRYGETFLTSKRAVAQLVYPLLPNKWGCVFRGEKGKILSRGAHIRDIPAYLHMAQSERNKIPIKFFHWVTPENTVFLIEVTPLGVAL